MVEIFFMLAYVLLFIMVKPDQLRKLLGMIAGTIQIVSFASAIFAFALLLSRVLFYFRLERTLIITEYEWSIMGTC